MPIRIRITKNRIAAIRAQLPRIEQDIADETAPALAAAMAEQMIANDQLLTSAMVNSVYAVTSRGSGYSAATARARELRPEVEPLPEIATPPAGQAAVSVAMPYAEEQNYGGVGRSGRAFLEPAVEAERAAFEQRLATLEERLK